MKRSVSSALFLALAAWAFSISSAQAASSKSSSDPLKQINFGCHRYIVLFFILHDCPICNQYMPEMNRIAQSYSDRGFGFYALYEDDDFLPAEATKHALEYHLTFPFLIDQSHALAAVTGTSIVPEAVVMNATREVFYRGRIDDFFADLDKRRPQALHHDLREALDAISLGKTPENKLKPGIGCAIGRNSTTQ